MLIIRHGGLLDGSFGYHFGAGVDHFLVFRDQDSTGGETVHRTWHRLGATGSLEWPLVLKHGSKGEQTAAQGIQKKGSQ